MIEAPGTYTVTSLSDNGANTVAMSQTVTLDIKSGTFTLVDGETGYGTISVENGATLDAGGTVAGYITLNSVGNNTDLVVSANNLTLNQLLVLSDSSANRIYGATAAAVLTNDSGISGAGQIGNGQLTLVNNSYIYASGTNSLILNTGGNTIVNNGTLFAFNGDLIVESKEPASEFWTGR
jgi:hypothetical protein